ncbi:MAG: glycosyltransferase [Candidatus Omnitrophota bacterium]
MSEKKIDILIPTCSRLTALAITLTGLCAQSFNEFDVVISDQSDDDTIHTSKEIAAVKAVLASHGNQLIIMTNIPKKGMAEQRQFLLNQVNKPYCLFLDDDLLIENDMLSRLLNAIVEEKCGFVGAAPIGLSYIQDVRPHEQQIEFWVGPVKPETIIPGDQKWKRHSLHNAANIYHVQQELKLSPENQKKYKVAWVGGCVLYDSEKLKKAGGYSFWQDLPPNHCGEDVLAQLRVMKKFGGCGIIPSGVYHLEIPTMVTDRRINAPEFLNRGRDARPHDNV